MGRFDSYFASDPDDLIIENPTEKPVIVQPVFATFITTVEPGHD
jgi:hypothetical protein